MFCSKCGKEIDDEALICSGCGTPTSNYKQENHNERKPLTVLEQNKILIGAEKNLHIADAIFIISFVLCMLLVFTVVDDYYPLVVGFSFITTLITLMCNIDSLVKLRILSGRMASELKSHHICSAILSGLTTLIVLFVALSKSGVLENLYWKIKLFSYY